MVAMIRSGWSVAFLLAFFFWAGVSYATRAAESAGQENPGVQPLAVLVDGSGTYGRPGTAETPAAQSFFDQGLRLVWGYYAVEAAASFQEALRLEPDNAMLYWGLALAISPNPNSRYQGVPDDPKGEGRKAIQWALALSAGTNQSSGTLSKLWRFATIRPDTPSVMRATMPMSTLLSRLPSSTRKTRMRLLFMRMR